MLLEPLRRLLVRPLVGLWLEFSPHSWKKHVIPHDSPHIHAPGMDPDRLLIAGDGAASGRGVRTHELGLPGFLARSLSSRTGRATDVDMEVDDDMTVSSCQAALDQRDLSRYDVVILTVGANEALALMPPREWQESIRRLLHTVRRDTPATTRVFVLAIPVFSINPHFPAVFATTVDFHVGMLNEVTERAAAELEHVDFVAEGRGLAFELEGIALYKQWADMLAGRVSSRLDPRRPHAADLSHSDELSRQSALEALEARPPGDDEALDRLTSRARSLFGTEMAAITFVRSDTQLFRTASGIDRVVLPRTESFCDVTIERDAVLIIEDATADERFADFSVVAGEPGIRFYAGHPIETPSGFRVGALCVMDTHPRRFSDSEAAALRTLAQQVQSHLYEGLTA